MKKLLLIFSAAVLGLSSCSSGPVGPQGPQGVPGKDGGLVYAEAIELITDFTPANNYRLEEPFGFDLEPADVTLIYILWQVADNGVEIWRPLPQTAYLDAGLLTYNYDFTRGDFSIFLDGTVPNFANVPAAYRNNQVFRIVIIPSEFLEKGRIKSKSYEDITATFGIKESDFVKRDLR